MRKFDPVILSKFIEGKNIVNLRTVLDEKRLPDEEVRGIINQGFVADCLIANPDMIGKRFDNMLIDTENKIPWRVDCGTGLDYNAAGNKKGENEFTPTIIELEAFRNSKLNFRPAYFFGTLTNEEIVEQIKKILPRKEAFLKVIPAHLKKIMAERFHYLNVYMEKLTRSEPNRLLHKVWKGKEISGKELLKATKQLQRDWSKEVTPLSLLYEKAAEKLIAEGKIEKAFEARSFSAQSIPMPENHPLYMMQDAISKGTEKQPDSSFGAFFSGFGSDDFRAFNRTFTDGKEAHWFEFELTHSSRTKLEKTIKLIQDNPGLFKTALPKDLQNFSLDGGTHCFKVRNKRGDFSNEGFKIEEDVQNVWKITIPDVLDVSIVKNPEIGCLYNNISVELNPKLPNEKKLEVFHQLFTMLGLSSIVCPKRPEDEERIKIAQLFRTYYPREAWEIERTPEFYETPVEKLKKQIVDRVPDMRNIFYKYLVESPHLLKKDNIYPGKDVWSVNDLSSQMREVGAYGLYATILGEARYHMSLEETAHRVASILKNGLLSTKDRFETGFLIEGSEANGVLKSGGGDHVFTRLCTKNTQVDFSTVCNNGDGRVALLFNLDAINRGSYAYAADNYGQKNSFNNKDYQQRPNLIEFAKNLGKQHFQNEVMIPRRIKPVDISGIVVPNKKYKKDLTRELKKAGIKSFNGKKLNVFIHVAKKGPAQKKLWN